MKTHFLALIALGLFCAAARAQNPAPLAATELKSEAKSEIAKAPMPRTLIDRDALRSIEIMTDRRESVAQFFARQKLVLASSPVLEGKFVREAKEFQSEKTRALFVSHPLPNDEDFRLNLFGAFFQLAPPTPEVMALLQAPGAAPGSRQTLLILAPDAQTANDERQNARLVGRIHISGAWWPSQEAEFLTFAPATNDQK